MRSYLLYTLLFLYLLPMPVLSQQDLRKIYLHPKAAGSEKQAKFVDSIRVIPLEVNDGVGLTNFNSVEITKNYFLIRDPVGKRVFFYSKNGKFIKKVSYKRLGENFYASYNEQDDQLVFLGSNKNYSLTSKDKLKIMLDWSNPRNKKYFKKYIINLADSSFALHKAEPTENDIIRSHPF
ncbi:MAG TPA: 6-bladed beta-propeller, partial [Chitinophagaceae bacterium]